MQRDMIEKTSKYMDQILLFYDSEAQCTMFERKCDVFDRRQNRNVLEGRRSNGRSVKGISVNMKPPQDHVGRSKDENDMVVKRAGAIEYFVTSEDDKVLDGRPR